MESKPWLEEEKDALMLIVNKSRCLPRERRKERFTSFEKRLGEKGYNRTVVEIQKFLKHFVQSRRDQTQAEASTAGNQPSPSQTVTVTGQTQAKSSPSGNQPSPSKAVTVKGVNKTPQTVNLDQAKVNSPAVNTTKKKATTNDVIPISHIEQVVNTNDSNKTLLKQNENNPIKSEKIAEQEINVLGSSDKLKLNSKKSRRGEEKASTMSTEKKEKNIPQIASSETTKHLPLEKNEQLQTDNNAAGSLESSKEIRICKANEIQFQKKTTVGVNKTPQTVNVHQAMVIFPAVSTTKKKATTNDVIPTSHIEQVVNTNDSNKTLLKQNENNPIKSEKIAEQEINVLGSSDKLKLNSKKSRRGEEKASTMSTEKKEKNIPQIASSETTKHLPLEKNEQLQTDNNAAGSLESSKEIRICKANEIQFQKKTTVGVNKTPQTVNVHQAMVIFPAVSTTKKKATTNDVIPTSHIEQVVNTNDSNKTLLKQNENNPIKSEKIAEQEINVLGSSDKLKLNSKKSRPDEEKASTMSTEKKEKNIPQIASSETTKHLPLEKNEQLQTDNNAAGSLESSKEIRICKPNEIQFQKKTSVAKSSENKPMNAKRTRPKKTTGKKAIDSCESHPQIVDAKQAITATKHSVKENQSTPVQCDSKTSNVINEPNPESVALSECQSEETTQNKKAKVTKQTKRHKFCICNERVCICDNNQAPLDPIPKYTMRRRSCDKNNSLNDKKVKTSITDGRTRDEINVAPSMITKCQCTMNNCICINICPKQIVKTTIRQTRKRSTDLESYVEKSPKQACLLEDGPTAANPLENKPSKQKIIRLQNMTEEKIIMSCETKSVNQIVAERDVVKGTHTVLVHCHEDNEASKLNMVSFPATPYYNNRRKQKVTRSQNNNDQEIVSCCESKTVNQIIAGRDIIEGTKDKVLIQSKLDENNPNSTFKGNEPTIFESKIPAEELNKVDFDKTEITKALECLSDSNVSKAIKETNHLSADFCESHLDENKSKNQQIENVTFAIKKPAKVCSCNEKVCICHNNLAVLEQHNICIHEEKILKNSFLNDRERGEVNVAPAKITTCGCIINKCTCVQSSPSQSNETTTKCARKRSIDLINRIEMSSKTDCLSGDTTVKDNFSRNEPMTKSVVGSQKNTCGHDEPNQRVKITCGVTRKRSSAWKNCAERPQKLARLSRNRPRAGNTTFQNNSFIQNMLLRLEKKFMLRLTKMERNLRIIQRRQVIILRRQTRINRRLQSKTNDTINNEKN